MNLSAPFVRRPVATTLLTIGATLVGIVAFVRLSGRLQTAASARA